MISKPARVVEGERRWGKSYSTRYASADFEFIAFVDQYGRTVPKHDMYDFIEFHRDQAWYWRACVEEFREAFKVVGVIYPEWDQ